MQSHAGRELPKGDDPRTDHRRLFTRISRAGIPKRPLPNCQAGPTPLSTPLLRGFRDAQMPWGGHPWWTGPLTPSLRGLWVSGYLSRAMANRARAATRKPTRRGRLGPRVGIPKRTRPKLPLNGVLSNQRGLHQCEKERGPKGPTPASWRHLLLRVVAATAGTQWTDGWGRSTYVLAFFVYGRHSVSRQSAELPCCPSATWYPPCCDPVPFATAARIPLLLPISRLHHERLFSR